MKSDTLQDNYNNNNNNNNNVLNSVVEEIDIASGNVLFVLHSNTGDTDVCLENGEW